MDLLRTPDDRFAALAGFDHEPQYADVSDGEGGSLADVVGGGRAGRRARRTPAARRAHLVLPLPRT